MLRESASWEERAEWGGTTGIPVEVLGPCGGSGQGHMAFRTRACISRVTSVFQEKQPLETGAQWLRMEVGMSWFQIAEVSSKQPQGCSVLHPPWLEGPFSHLTSNPAGTAFLHMR